jgi:hypothetical protein
MRILLGLATIFIATHASPQWRDAADPESYIKVFTLNDLFNASWTVNTDDYRSFGFGAEMLNRSRWRFFLDYSSITNRENAPQGSGTRIDECGLRAERIFSYYGDFQRLDIVPAAGVLVFGNLQSQAIQNAWHRLSSLPEVRMSYDGRTQPTGIFGGSVAYAFNDKIFTSAEFSMVTRSLALVRPWYDARLEIGESAHLKGSAGDLFSLEFLYRYVEPFSMSPTVRRLSEVETGWTWRYAVQCGGLYAFDEFNLSTGSATGSIGFALQLDTSAAEFTKEDFVFEGGMVTLMKGLCARIKAHPWTDGRFNCMADYTFLFPGDVDYPTIRVNHQQLVLGGEASLFPVKSGFTINPFIGAGIGIHRVLRYSDVLPDFALEQYVSPIVMGMAGLRLSRRISWKVLPDNVVYGISVADRISVPLHRIRKESHGKMVTYIAPLNTIPVSMMTAVDF